MSSHLIKPTVDLLQTLPAMPRIAQEILAINLATDQGNEMLLKLIGKDLAISARIVGLANSPLFGTSRKILSIGDAAKVLGIKRIKMVALSFAMISSLSKNSSGLLNITQLWQHSMAVALAMETLAQFMPENLRPASEAIYLSGLLHDIGFLVLEHVNPELSHAFHSRLAVEKSRLSVELENEMLEMNHCELGALLAEHWHLATDIVAVLRHHHASTVPEETPGKPLIKMANLIEKLLPTFGMIEPVAVTINREEWAALGIDAARETEIRTRIQTRAEEMAAALA